jgi:hypothetical protein
MALNLDRLVKPIRTVPSSVGDIFLYRLRTSDYEGLAVIAGSTSTDRVRSFLPRVASLVQVKSFNEDRPPLSAAAIRQLSDTEVEGLASQYAASLLHPPRKDAERPQPERQEAEAASSFLERLLQNEVAEQSLQMQKLRESVTSSTTSMFDQVRKSTSKLGTTVGAFDRLYESQNQVESLLVPTLDHTNAITKQYERQARERAEELQMVRLTGKMTAESAETLRSLAEAATTLLEQMDQRDRKSDRVTNRQITIAVWSVGVSAALALLALVISTFSYLQDRNKNESEDKWQTELVNLVKKTNQQRASEKFKVEQLETELEKLKVQNSAVRPEAALPAKTSSAVR